MKALRYLLVAIAMMLTALPAGAQYTKVNSVAGCTTFGQTERKYQFHTTSAILVADSSLGLSEGGAFTTGVSTGNPVTTTGPRRATMEDDPFGGETIGGTENPQQPGTPVGDGLWALLLMAAGYLIYRVRTRKREVTA